MNVARGLTGFHSGWRKLTASLQGQCRLDNGRLQAARETPCRREHAEISGFLGPPASARQPNRDGGIPLDFQDRVSMGFDLVPRNNVGLGSVRKCQTKKTALSLQSHAESKKSVVILILRKLDRVPRGERDFYRVEAIARKSQRHGIVSQNGRANERSARDFGLDR